MSVWGYGSSYQPYMQGKTMGQPMGAFGMQSKRTAGPQAPITPEAIQTSGFGLGAMPDPMETLGNAPITQTQNLGSPNIYGRRENRGPNETYIMGSGGGYWQRDWANPLANIGEYFSGVFANDDSATGQSFVPSKGAQGLGVDLGGLGGLQSQFGQLKFEDLARLQKDLPGLQGAFQSAQQNLSNAYANPEFANYAGDVNPFGNIRMNQQQASDYLQNAYQSLLGQMNQYRLL